MQKLAILLLKLGMNGANKDWKLYDEFVKVIFFKVNKRRGTIKVRGLGKQSNNQ